MIVGVDEEAQVLAELVVAVVVIAFDGGFLDSAVHALDLAVGPRVVGLGEPVPDVVLGADAIEHVEAVARSDRCGAAAHGPHKPSREDDDGCHLCRG